MKAKSFVCMLPVLMLTTICLAETQQSGKIYRVGILSGGLSASSFHTREALRQELRALGYIEGKNVVFLARSAEEKLDRLPALADDLIRRKVDLIVAGGP